jgi:hypothetical protein
LDGQRPGFYLSQPGPATLGQGVGSLVQNAPVAGSAVDYNRLFEWTGFIRDRCEPSMGELLFHHERHRCGRERLRAGERCGKGTHQRGAGGTTSRHRGCKEILAVAVRLLGESNGRENSNSESENLIPGRGSYVHHRIVYRKGKLARSSSAAGKVNGSNGHDAGYGAPPLNGDPLPFDLLIKQRGHLPGHPAECQKSVIPDATDYVPRFVQRTDDEPLYGSAAHLNPRIAGSVTDCAGEKAEQSVHHRALESGDRGKRSETSGQRADIR